MTYVHSVGAKRDAWHTWLRLLAKLRSAVHHRRLIWQFGQMNTHDPKDAPFAILRSGRHVDVAQRSLRRSRAWVGRRGEEIPSSAILTFANMHARGY